MKLLLVKALSEAHPYNRFVDALDAGFRALGHEAVITDQEPFVVNGAAPADDLIRQLQAGRYDALLSFNSFFGAVTLADGRALYDALGVKFLGWQLDHPIYTPQSLARPLKARYSVYSNANHLRFAQAIRLPGHGISMVAGGEPLGVPLKPYAARACPVFIAASYYGPPQALWEQMEDSAGKRLLQGVVERLLADREASLLDAFNETSEAMGLGAALGADPAFDDQMIAFLREPLTYVRNLDRTNVIRALVQSDLPVTICGPGWRGAMGERPGLTYLEGRVDFRDLPGLYNDARIVINMNAGNGACERALSAALAGAAVVSDDSGDLARQFAPGEEIAFFDRVRPASVCQTVANLLESPGLGESIARRGFEQASASGLWRHRAQTLVDYLQAG